MRSLRNSVKRGVERLSGYRVWLEKPSDLDEVRDVIRSLAPVAIDQNLIRIGGEGDGGYLIPDDLESLVSAISPGTSTEVGFDLDMANRGIDVLMADASVDGPPFENPHFHFHRKFVDVFEDEQNMRLDTLCGSHRVDSDGDRILQMDIEGAEYRVLLDLSDDMLKSFRIMVVEFHDLDRMFASFPLRIIKATFQKLLRHHHIVHIHPNNVAGPSTRGDIEIPPVMEFTFYRKDRSTVTTDRKLPFPHLHDHDNLASCPSLVLPKCWR
jgi:hypothetical protein